jgi:uncharacterized protein (TIGR02217 family)
MAFHEVRFPPALSFGALGGPERRTEIVTLASGHEERNSPWSQSRRRWDAGLGLRSLDDLHELIAFWEARLGPLHGFRWKDWADHRSGPPSRDPDPLDQFLGRGDDARTEFQLRKTYRSGAALQRRPIAKPVAGTVRVALGGVEQREDVHWTLDPATGLVVFADPPAGGAEITAGFEFDVPVRFENDRLLLQISTFGAGEAPSVPVVELRG